MRHDMSHVERGMPYAVEWPEYHVDCGYDGCDEHALLTHTGEVATRKAAERAVSERGFAEGGEGWKKKQGRWYCSVHGPQRRILTREGSAVLANMAGEAIDAMMS